MVKGDSRRRAYLQRISLAAGTVLFAAGLIFRLSKPMDFFVFLAAYLLTGGQILWQAARNIVKGEVFDENFLMAVATIGAFAIGEYAEGVAVMLFYRIGEFFEDLAVGRSRRSISALMDLRPDSASLLVGDNVQKVAPEEVAVGERILVRPGEKVPLDGRVTEGTSSVDTSALTGESVPRRVEPGAEVLAGFVNGGGLLTVKTEKVFGESSLAKIMDLVRNAETRKAPAEKFITKFARYYTPAVVFSALALAVVPPLVLGGASFTEWIYRALTFLVVSCPCALVISVPLSYFAGIGGASKQGVLIKGSNYLEALDQIDTVVFDKTGTLTKGNFQVTQVLPAEGFKKEDILDYTAHAELYSSHPVAVSIRDAFGSEPDAQRVSDYEEIAGKGIRARVDGKPVLAGNAGLMASEKISVPKPETAGTAVYLAVGRQFAGMILIADELKPDSAQAVSGLKSAGVRRTAMLTGDRKETGENVARKLGIDSVYSELLPEQKVERLEQLAHEVPQGKKLMFVGDGINDAPVLARADVGVAMGALGSDAAIEAADIVLMTDEPSCLLSALRIAKKTKRIVRQNIGFTIAVKITILVLAALGLATMWAAVFGDVGVTILAVLNAARAV
ncbi:MAG: cadmium-translocating P-type ATPase [Oscillospiraceae bacterium]|jgi:Cd2+/Zn2+-exporting ATPase|nr:cadmium-translocating P-type ATPase [Oscillospiraceae bacterium]